MRGSGGRIRVLIVEDSQPVRLLLEHVIGRDPRFAVVGTAASGEAALEMLARASPDVVSMDLHLPGMDGLETVREIMHVRPTPTVVVSASVRRDDVRISMEALRAGALAAVEKPPGPSDPSHETLVARLLGQLELMSRVRVIRQRRFMVRTPAPAPPRRVGEADFAALGIVASTGGPGALAVLLRALPADYPLPILLVQHIGESFLDGFVGWLADLARLPVVRAADGDAVRAGVIHVAPPDRHLVVERGRLRLLDTPPVCYQRPSGTVLMESMARAYGPGALGVVLTGMGSDGAEGLGAIRRRGGHTIAEDASTAVVYGMPRAAAELGAVTESLPLPAIGPRLVDLAGRGVRG